MSETRAARKMAFEKTKEVKGRNSSNRMQELPTNIGQFPMKKCSVVLARLPPELHCVDELSAKTRSVTAKESIENVAKNKNRMVKEQEILPMKYCSVVWTRSSPDHLRCQKINELPAKMQLNNSKESIKNATKGKIKNQTVKFQEPPRHWNATTMATSVSPLLTDNDGKVFDIESANELKMHETMKCSVVLTQLPPAFRQTGRKCEMHPSSSSTQLIANGMKNINGTVNAHEIPKQPESTTKATATASTSSGMTENAGVNENLAGLHELSPDVLEIEENPKQPTKKRRRITKPTFRWDMTRIEHAQYELRTKSQQRKSDENNYSLLSSSNMRTIACYNSSVNRLTSMRNIVSVTVQFLFFVSFIYFFACILFYFRQILIESVRMIVRGSQCAQFLIRRKVNQTHHQINIECQQNPSQKKTKMWV